MVSNIVSYQIVNIVLCLSIICKYCKCKKNMRSVIVQAKSCIFLSVFYKIKVVLPKIVDLICSLINYYILA